MNLKIAIKPAVTFLTTLCLLLSTGGTAAAGIEPFMEGIDVVDLVNEVAPYRGDIVAAGNVTLPGSNELVTIAPSSGVAAAVISEEGDTVLEIPLPVESARLPDGASEDGSLAYTTAGAVDAVVQLLDDGATRVQTVLQEDSSKEQRYAIPSGFQASLTDDGGVALLGETGTAVVEAPWARDANGSPIPTNYAIEEDFIVQRVETTPETAYPVVADPTWMWYSAAYGMRFSKKETRDFASYGSTAGFCALFSRLAPNMAWACGLYGAYFFTRSKQISAAQQCMFISVVPAPLALNYYGKGCK